MKPLFVKSEIAKLQPTGKIWPVVCFCVAYELRNAGVIFLLWFKIGEAPFLTYDISLYGKN